MSAAIVERIARHLFDLTPAGSDPERAMEFAREAAGHYVRQFETDARVLKPKTTKDGKALAAGEGRDAEGTEASEDSQQSTAVLRVREPEPAGERDDVDVCEEVSGEGESPNRDLRGMFD